MLAAHTAVIDYELGIQYFFTNQEGAGVLKIEAIPFNLFPISTCLGVLCRLDIQTMGSPQDVAGKQRHHHNKNAHEHKSADESTCS
jgi:hypothetical protein